MGPVKGLREEMDQIIVIDTFMTGECDFDCPRVALNRANEASASADWLCTWLENQQLNCECWSFSSFRPESAFEVGNRRWDNAPQRSVLPTPRAETSPQSTTKPQSTANPASYFLVNYFLFLSLSILANHLHTLSSVRPFLNGVRNHIAN